MAGQAAGIAGSSSTVYLQQKEGRESSLAQPAAADEDADDVGVQKRIAQVRSSHMMLSTAAVLLLLLCLPGSYSCVVCVGVRVHVAQHKQGSSSSLDTATV
jgi:hypothetical protein